MNEHLTGDERKEIFESGIAYEGLREALNNEMARHSSLVGQYGEQSLLGQEHLQSMAALAEVRRHLTPNNTELLLVVELMLKSYQSDLHSV